MRFLRRRHTGGVVTLYRIVTSPAVPPASFRPAAGHASH